MSNANAFNMDQSKILSFGGGLNPFQQSIAHRFTLALSRSVAFISPMTCPIAFPSSISVTVRCMSIGGSFTLLILTARVLEIFSLVPSGTVSPHETLKGERKREKET